MEKKFCSILTKIRVAFLSLFAAFLLILAYILGIQYKNRSLEDIYNQIKYEDELLAQSIEEKAESTNSSINMIILYLNEMIPSTYLNEYNGPLISAEIQRIIYRCMIHTFTNFYNAEQVMIVWNNGVTWYENWTENYSMQNGGEALLAELEELQVERTGCWLTQIVSDSSISGSGCYYAKKYVDIKTGERHGYVVLKIESILEQVNKKDIEREMYVFDNTGNLVQCSDAEIISERNECKTVGEIQTYSIELKTKLTQLETKNKQIVHRVKFNSGWELVSVNDISKKMKELDRSILLILFVSVSLMCLIYQITFRIIKRVLLPIHKLSSHMNEFKGQLLEPIHLPTQNDETGILIRHFNKMAERNKELVAMLLQEKKEQEQLKMSLLQAQIKPHFLYNTLDTIYCLVVMEKNEEASRMTKLLSMYYRHVLSRGMDWVLLSEEVEQTKNYLQIQKIRYSDTLEFSVCVNENVENIKIPKLTLQPLVENAIYHGIKPTGRKGNLRIEISQIKKEIFIRIKDDGMGFPNELFEECVISDHCTEGFGLKNVVDRLNIYYKNRCCVKMEEQAVGTCILIIIKI